MAMRSCRVTIQDLDGVARPKMRRAGPPKGGRQAHSVEVTASTLYEAVALPWRAGEVGGEEGWVAAGGVSAGEGTGHIGGGERDGGALIVDRFCLIELGAAGVLPRSLHCAGRAQKPCARNGGLLRS